MKSSSGALAGVGSTERERKDSLTFYLSAETLCFAVPASTETSATVAPFAIESDSLHHRLQKIIGTW